MIFSSLRDIFFVLFFRVFHADLFETNKNFRGGEKSFPDPKVQPTLGNKSCEKLLFECCSV